jgi:hypothetical protein
VLEWSATESRKERARVDTPTLSLDFLRKQSNTWLESECLIQTTNERMTLTS